MDKKSIAIITARGGSKRVPKKNIREFCGKPILSYSIQAALSCNLFNEVMVSTDSREIADIAEAYGAKVPFLRSLATSGDYATTSDVLIEVLFEYKKLGVSFDKLCCIYPTAPFVTAEKLEMAMRLLDNIEVDSVIPVTAFSFPPMRGMYIRNGFLEYSYPEYVKKRSQDIETMYHDSGQFYCIKTKVFLQTKTLVPEKTKAIILPEMEIQDIDTLEDWKLAELKYQNMACRKTIRE